MFKKNEQTRGEPQSQMENVKIGFLSLSGFLGHFEFLIKQNSDYLALTV